MRKTTDCLPPGGAPRRRGPGGGRRRAQLWWVALASAVVSCQQTPSPSTDQAETVSSPKLLWEHLEASRVSPASLVGERLFFGTEDGDVVSLALSDGAEGWRATAPGPIARRPVGLGDAVAVVTTTGVLALYGQADGQLRWTTELDAEVVADPTVQANLLLIGTDDGRAMAFDGSSPEPVLSLAFESSIRFPLAADDERIFVATHDGRLVAVDQLDGSVSWEIAPNWNYVIGQPQVWLDWLVIGGYEDVVYCVERQTGETAWTYGVGNWLVALPFVSDSGVAYFGSALGALSAVEVESGRPLWRNHEQLVWGSRADLRAEGQLLYVARLDGRLSAVRLSDGSTVGSWELANGFSDSTWASDRVVLSSEHSLRALTLPFASP